MLRKFLTLVILGGLGAGGFVVHRHYSDQARLERELAARERAIANLTRERRVAQAVLRDRWVGEDGRTRQRIRFVEVDDEGRSIEGRTIEIEGDEVYFDALVIKFERGLVQEGDPLRGKSVLLFRRVYGDRQEPAEGVALDEAEDGVPTAYRSGGAVSEVERELWARFWEIANDPDAREEAGVRVAQIEAVGGRMQKGLLYELTLDAAGGMNLKATRLPAVLVDEEE